MMWPFKSKQKSQPLSPKETSAVEDWDISLWLLDPNRTADELDYYAQTGQRPTEFIKMPPIESTQSESLLTKGNIVFPSDPQEGDTFFDAFSGGYYVWGENRWKTIANAPPSLPLETKNIETWFQLLDEQKFLQIVSKLERPYFSNQLEEKQWCAQETSRLLNCQVGVYEYQGEGLIIFGGKEYWHSMKNWDWENKKAEEFFPHLYGLYELYKAGEK